MAAGYLRWRVHCEPGCALCHSKLELPWRDVSNQLRYFVTGVGHHPAGSGAAADEHVIWITRETTICMRSIFDAISAIKIQQQRADEDAADR